MVIKYLMEYAQSLASPKGRDYCRKFETQPQLFVNMFNNIQTIWRVFLELGMQVDCLQMVRNGQSLPVKLFEPAITTARMMLNGLITTINCGEMLEYKHIPAVFVFFYPNSRSEPGDPAFLSASTPDTKRLRTDNGNKQATGSNRVSPDSQSSPHRKADTGKAKIMEPVRDMKDKAHKDPAYIKFKCLVNNDFEEVVAYNDLVDFIEKDTT